METANGKNAKDHFHQLQDFPPPCPPSTSNWLQLVVINLVSLGVDLCTSAGFSYIPPLMLKAGFTAGAMTSVLGIGPFLSLLLVPALGRWSDRHWSCLGRRRPFILGLSILLLTSLIVVPYCHELGPFLMTGPNGVLLTLSLGVIVLDFSSQALFNPCKALVSDCRQLRGFTVFTFMLNLGSAVGYLLTSLNWGNTALGRRLGGQEKAVFTLLFFVYTVFVVISLAVAKETRFPLLEHESQCPPSSVRVEHSKNGGKTRNGFKKVIFERYRSVSFADVCRSPLPSLVVMKKAILLRTRDVFLGVRDTCLQFSGFFDIPKNLFRLFVTDLLSWMAVHCHNDYYTDFVGQVIYKGKPQGIDASLYDEGVRMGSWGLLLQSLTAVLYAGFAQDWLISKIGPQKAFLFGMMTFTISMSGTLLTSCVQTVNIFSALSGLGVAAISTISCNLLTGYNLEKMEQVVEYEEPGRKRGLGEDMAVLDAASYLAQIIPFCFLGYLVRFYGSSSVYLAVSVVCGGLSCVAALFVVYPQTT